MNKEEVLKRAKSNGTKAAAARYRKDEATALEFSKDTDRLYQAFGEWASEIRQAFSDAYKEEAAAYIPKGHW